jgi:hypothetical protein
MKTLLILLVSCVSVLGGETIIPLKTGETNVISYGLACIVSDSGSTSNAPAGGDLVLTLRNVGAKAIGMDGVTVEDFSLRDAKGKEMKIYLWTKPRNMAFGTATIIHLSVVRPGDAPQPWTLHFKTKASEHVPVELTIDGIQPRKK